MATQTIVLTDILQNASFNNLAAIVRVGLSRSWQYNTNANIHALFGQLAQLVFAGQDEDVCATAVALLEEIAITVTAADTHLHFNPDDLSWIKEQINSEYGIAVLAMFCTWSFAPDTTVTPAEVAAVTHTSQSKWRNNAAAGKIPGAVIAGKQWLLPVSILRSQGTTI